MLLLVALLGCVAAPVIPGPLGPVGRSGWSRPPGQEATRTPGAGASTDTDALALPDAWEGSSLGEAVASSAAHYLVAPPKGYRDDCSGFVCAVFGRAGVALDGNTRSLWEQALSAGATHRRKLPAPGDLAFFDDTYDRDRDGRTNDELTHVAVVLEVDRQGTITLAHAGTSRGRVTARMNLRRPHDHADDDGEVLNDFLRAPKASDPAGTRYLTGELWRGFATVHPEDDAWASR